MKNRKVPKLRFKEFTEEWEEKRLGTVLTESKIKGDTGEKAKKLTVKLWGKGVIEKKEITQGSSITQYYIRKAGQFIYGKLDFLNAAFGIIPQELNNYQSTLDSPAFDIDIVKCNSRFLLNRVLQKNFYKKFGDTANGSRKAKRIHTNIFLDMFMFFPRLPEQQKIADFLSCIDIKISLTEEKLENLKIYKKGIMQKIFSQEIRFKDKNGNDYPEWEETKLGDLVEEYIEKTIINNQYQVLSSTATGIYLQEEYFNRQIASSNNIGYKIIKRNHLVLSPQNLWLGNINVNLKYEIGIVSPSYKIFSILENKVLIEYLKEIIKSEQMLYEYKNASEQGASIVRRNLDIEQFYNIKIVLPILEEQQKIADFLSSIDDKIEKTEKKLNELKEFKKGLLQKMFV